MENRKLFDQAKRQVMEHPTLMDDVPFTVAVRRSMALAQLIIRTTLSQEDLVVTDVRCQEKVPGIGHKGVVFDALCFDGCGNMYDVEVQKGHFEDLPKRAAFYEAMLTVHSLGSGGRNYDRMPKQVVIFICDGDVEKRGEAVYDYSRRSADGMMLGDGGRIVFVNGEYRADDAIGHLMADMDQSDPERACGRCHRTSDGGHGPERPGKGVQRGSQGKPDDACRRGGIEGDERRDGEDTG